MCTEHVTYCQKFPLFRVHTSEKEETENYDFTQHYKNIDVCKNYSEIPSKINRSKWDIKQFIL